MDGKERRANVKNPRATANFLSAITFSWVFPTFWLGYRRDLETEDLYSPLKEHTSSILGDRIAKAWEEELKRVSNDREEQKEEDDDGRSSARKPKQPSLLRVILKCFGPQAMVYGIAMAIGQIVLGVGQPLLLGRLLQSYSTNAGGELGNSEAYLYAGGVVLCSFLKVFVNSQYIMASMHMSMKIRIACCTLIYRKALRLSKTALGGTTIGQTVNLLSNDVSRFDTSIVFLHFMWLGPLLTIIMTYFMYTLVGMSAIIGIASLLLFIPLQGLLGKLASVYRLRTARRTDERIRLTNEIITGIQAIKMYTWEKPFGDLIEMARKREINVITAVSYVRGIVTTFMIFVPRFCLFVTVLAYILSGNDVTVEKVFMLTAYFNSLRDPMTIYFPEGATQGAEAMVSIKRLQDFMMYDETTTIKKVGGGEKADKTAENGSIKMKNGSAKWLEDSENDTLREFNLEIKPGQLIAIVGEVGSGKSSLLHTILREMPLNAGSIEVSGIVAYASQDPWLFAGTVKQNILFSNDMDPCKYEKVVKVCQLKKDFTLFPYGDKTVVGERGVSLSGGQRARINLARAVYADADIYLMDDPLSAVDTRVGKHVFEECIAGYLKGKTRILVTHQLQYLRNVDRIIVLKDGAVKAQGTWDELQASGMDLGQLLETPEENTPVFNRQISRTVSRRSSVGSEKSEKTEDIFEEQKTPKEVAEARSSGSVSGKVYADYLRAGGNWCTISLIVILFLSTQIFGSASDFFISYWVDLEEVNVLAVEWDSILSRDLCVSIYSGLVVGTVILALICAVSFFKVSMRASKRLHDKMFRGISRATMRFFNTNPSGRILNRFSKDMGAVDELLPIAMIECAQIALGLLGIIIVIGISSPWLMIPTVVIGVVFYYLRVVYLVTSRSVKRLEGITRSPVFSHLNATLQGLTTIRAFEAGEVLVKEFDHHQDLHSSAWFIFVASSRAFAFWLDIICVVYIVLVTFNFLVLPDLDSTGGSVGLAITQSIGLTSVFQYGMRQSAEVENHMTSVERILEYSVVDQEPSLESTAPQSQNAELENQITSVERVDENTVVDQEPLLKSTSQNKRDPSWPSEGRVEFKKFSMRYGPSDPLVLKDVNFVVEPRQKIGIVGRTGAGKSSLVTALFRLAYPSGEIVIDGIESGKLGLHDLRSKISIIPQEPFLFSGSLRRNLDPFDEYPDSALWQALEKVELKEMGLELHVAEGGSNLSVGQRQLVCLARAIVRNNRILILDEATANVDSMTDELIQRTIREIFANCTVLTIAHRLNTVMDSDKVLVMDAGTVVEYDHPHVLLQKENGYLRGMVDQTGRSMAEVLSLVAENNYLPLHES